MGNVFGFFSIVLCFGLAAPVWAARPPGQLGAITPKAATSQTASSALDDSVKSALSSLKPSLGNLSSWQRLIFDAEVMANGQDFVREHRLVGSQVKVELDEALIRRTLSFYAPQVLGNAEPRAAVRVEASDSCSICAGAVEPIKKLLQVRLESRGIKPVWFKDEELPSTPAQGTPALLAGGLPRFGFLRALEISRGLQGSVLVRIESGQDASSANADPETAHPEDAKFMIRLGMTLGNFVVYKKVELQPSQSPETLARRLWNEAMADITDRASAGRLSPGAGSAVELAVIPEVLVSVAGVKDYFSLTALKSQIQVAVGGLSPVIERSLARGRVLLAIRTSAPVDEIRGKLSGVAVGQQKLVLSSGSGASGLAAFFGQGTSTVEGELK